jgi:hypothetical protein
MPDATGANGVVNEGSGLEGKALMHLQDGIRGRGLRDLSKASKLTLVGTAALVVAACGSTTTGSSSPASVSNPGVPSGISVSAFSTDIAVDHGDCSSP